MQNLMDWSLFFFVQSQTNELNAQIMKLFWKFTTLSCLASISFPSLWKDHMMTNLEYNNSN